MLAVCAVVLGMFDVTFAARTVLLQRLILAALTMSGFQFVHAMVFKEEGHLAAPHGESCRQCRKGSRDTS